MSGAPTARLTRGRAASAGLAVLPARAPAQTGIVHLGLGGFHRAHQAVYTARALAQQDGPWGIAGVAMRSRGVVDALRAQDGLYGVLELGGDRRAPLVVGVHRELRVAADDPGAVVALVARADTRIVTLTVTEKGYTARAARSALDTRRTDVRADLAGAPPGTAIGLLARGLQRRLRAHGEPLAVVSCDNVSANGAHTRALVLDFVALLEDPDAGDLRAWIERDVGFPSTMVDRVVPAAGPEQRARAAELLGLQDAATVAAEPFCMWVLEDRFPGGRPRWEAAGAIFGDEVQRYEQLKLRLLNATHSLVAYLGLLAGEPTIAGALALAPIRAAAEHAMARELAPTLQPPAGVDVEVYAREVLARFENAALGDRTARVATDGSLKLPVRLGAAALARTERGELPRVLALVVAAYIRCLATPGAIDAARSGLPTDPRGAELELAGQRARGSRDLVEAVFALGIFAPELAAASAFVDAVAELHGELVRGGCDAAIAAATT